MASSVLAGVVLIAFLLPGLRHFSQDDGIFLIAEVLTLYYVISPAKPEAEAEAEASAAD